MHQELYMTDYYKEILELKTIQQKLIESGIIRAVECLISDLDIKSESSGLTIADIQSLNEKLEESLHAYTSAKNDTDDAYSRYKKSAEKAKKE